MRSYSCFRRIIGEGKCREWSASLAGGGGGGACASRVGAAAAGDGDCDDDILLSKKKTQWARMTGIYRYR